MGEAGGFERQAWFVSSNSASIAPRQSEDEAAERDAVVAFSEEGGDDLNAPLSLFFLFPKGVGFSCNRATSRLFISIFNTLVVARHRATRAQPGCNRLHAAKRLLQPRNH